MAISKHDRLYFLAGATLALTMLMPAAAASAGPTAREPFVGSETADYYPAGTYDSAEIPKVYLYLVKKYRKTIAKCGLNFAFLPSKKVPLLDQVSRKIAQETAEGLAADFANQMAGRPASDICRFSAVVTESLQEFAMAGLQSDTFYFSDESEYFPRPWPHRDWCTITVRIGTSEETADARSGQYKFCNARG